MKSPVQASAAQSCINLLGSTPQFLNPNLEKTCDGVIVSEFGNTSVCTAGCTGCSLLHGHLPPCSTTTRPHDSRDVYTANTHLTLCGIKKNRLEVGKGLKITQWTTLITVLGQTYNVNAMLFNVNSPVVPSAPHPIFLR